MATKKKDKENEIPWDRPTVSAIEADLAYVDARLSMLGDKADTSYQGAQLKAFRALESSLSDTLERLRRGRKKKRPSLDETTIFAEEISLQQFQEVAGEAASALPESTSVLGTSDFGETRIVKDVPTLPVEQGVVEVIDGSDDSYNPDSTTELTSHDILDITGRSNGSG